MTRGVFQLVVSEICEVLWYRGQYELDYGLRKRAGEERGEKREREREKRIIAV